MRIVSAVTFVSLLLGAAPTAVAISQEAAFLDVPASHPNAEAIAYVKAEGIVSGYTGGTYHPDEYINRVEFTKIVIGSNFTERALGFCVDYGFPDTSRTAWYAKYVCLAAQHKIIAGRPDGKFYPEDAINFVEAAKIIATVDNFYLNGVYYDNVMANGVMVGEPLPESRDGVWYEPYVRYLAGKNAIPVSITSFNSQITRGEMAEIIYRLKAKVTTKPSKTYEQFAGHNQPAAEAWYQLQPLPSYAVKNNAGNVVYRYAITAPADQDVTITNQTFTIEGGRWTGPQLAIFKNGFYNASVNQIDTWAEDDNWTEDNSATLRGTLTIPAGQTRYLSLSVSVNTPADGFTVTVTHPKLGTVTLNSLPQ
jgi:S-layer homology domain